MANTKFSETLKALRLQAGLTQKNAYDYLGVPQSTFSSWETGKAEPSADMLLRLCQLYEVADVLAAFGYKDTAKNETSADMRLLKSYHRLDEVSRQVVDSVIKIELSRKAPPILGEAKKKSYVADNNRQSTHLRVAQENAIYGK